MVDVEDRAKSLKKIKKSRFTTHVFKKKQGIITIT